MLQLPLDRPTALAEEVADHRGHQRRRGPGVPREAVLADRGHRAAEGVQPLEHRDLVAELGQPGRRGQAAEPAAHHDHPRHVRSTRRTSGAGSSGPNPVPYSRRGAAGEQVDRRQPLARHDRGARVDLGEEPAGRRRRPEQVAGLDLGALDRPAVVGDGVALWAAERALADGDHLADALGVHHRHQRLDVGRGEPDVVAGHERRLQQREEPPVDLAQRRGAGGHPGVELGGPEAVGAEHPVDAERAAVAVRGCEVVAHPAGGAAHLLPVGGGRVPVGAEPGVDELPPAGSRRRHDLHRPEDRRAVGQHVAVDRARHAVEERHHPDPVAARPEEPRGGGLVVLVEDPAHVVAAAVDAVARIAGPHRAQRPGSSAVASARAASSARRRAVRRVRHPGGLPDRVGERLVLQGQERRRATERDRPAVDRLVGGDERGGEPDPAPVRVERLDGGAQAAEGWRAIRSSCRTSSVIVDAGVARSRPPGSSVRPGSARRRGRGHHQHRAAEVAEPLDVARVPGEHPGPHQHRPAGVRLGQARGDRVAASSSLRSGHGPAPSGRRAPALPAPPAATDQLRHQVEHHQPEREQHAGDGGRGLGVLDREPHQRRAPRSPR